MSEGRGCRTDQWGRGMSGVQGRGWPRNDGGNRARLSPIGGWPCVASPCMLPAIHAPCKCLARPRPVPCAARREFALRIRANCCSGGGNRRGRTFKTDDVVKDTPMPGQHGGQSARIAAPAVPAAADSPPGLLHPLCLQRRTVRPDCCTLYLLLSLGSVARPGAAAYKTLGPPLISPKPWGRRSQALNPPKPRRPFCPQSSSWTCPPWPLR